ncbi:NAD-dependent epimerase/dehydratase family protein [Kaistella daneshvariae]|uniref:NAD-dependent epimerase/dehydratase family protein n=1 Tax=Kaistella daneshvariae TaxID=2487074 RepID=A0ABM7C6I2_9FLAO|nr:NAD-dependent epimerase/dehydratase family protein [Kaistella daneshvariae]AZI66579.1 NAD-dependent epimerase/dehydratase family protein [Kaistella daneshvariae]
MKITITGASGFVGKNVSQYLEAHQYYVETLSLRNSWKLNKTSNAVIHLAGKAHDIEKVSDHDEYFKINRDLTIQLFNEFLKSSTKDFFYFSSVKAAADSVEGFLDENFAANPATPYGKSKLEAENYLLSQKLPEGKRVFIIRPCMIHGPGNKGNLNLLYNVVNKGIPWPLAAFENHRSFLSIDNLNFLILKMLQNADIPSGIYNFADDQNLSTTEVVKIIGDTSGRSVKLWKINASLIKNLAKIGDIFSLPLNSERLGKLTENYIVSNQKIKNALQIDRLPVTAEQGLRKTIKSFQK